MLDEPMTSMLVMPQVPLVCAGAALLLNEYLRRPKLHIYVRPGVGAYGVGLICIRSVPPGTCICECTAEYSERVSALRLNMLRPSVRRTVLELFDGFDSADGTYSVPTKYDQAIPLISFINHNDEPNCEFDEASNCIRAMRQLKKDEECTVNYLQYQEKGSWTYRACQSGFRNFAFWA